MMMSKEEYKKELYRLYNEVTRFAGNKGLRDLLRGQLINLADFVAYHPKELEYIGVEDYHIISIAAAYLKSCYRSTLANHPEYKALKKKYLAFKAENDKSMHM